MVFLSCDVYVCINRAPSSHGGLLYIPSTSDIKISKSAWMFAASNADKLSLSLTWIPWCFIKFKIIFCYKLRKKLYKNMFKCQTSAMLCHWWVQNKTYHELTRRTAFEFHLKYSIRPCILRNELRHLKWVEYFWLVQLQYSSVATIMVDYSN